MRHFKLIALFLFILLQSCATPRQTPGVSVACPTFTRILPGYPAFEDREAFYNDSLLYSRGKALRGTERGKQAVEDSDMRLDYYLKRYGEVMGVSLSEQDSPAIAAYLNAVYNYTGQGIKNVKDATKRERPFRYFGEPSGIPDEEDTFGKSSSYPSGHTIIAWIMSLALSSIDEEHQYDIINLGYEIGRSRVIVGYHYQSDVDSGRMAASTAYARLVSDPEFIRLMKLARKELETLRRR